MKLAPELVVPRQQLAAVPGDGNEHPPSGLGEDVSEISAADVVPLVGQPLDLEADRVVEQQDGVPVLERIVGVDAQRQLAAQDVIELSLSGRRSSGAYAAMTLGLLALILPLRQWFVLAD